MKPSEPGPYRFYLDNRVLFFFKSTKCSLPDQWTVNGRPSLSGRRRGTSFVRRSATPFRRRQRRHKDATDTAAAADIVQWCVSLAPTLPLPSAPTGFYRVLPSFSWLQLDFFYQDLASLSFISHFQKDFLSFSEIHRIHFLLSLQAPVWFYRVFVGFFNEGNFCSLLIWGSPRDITGF